MIFYWSNHIVIFSTTENYDNFPTLFQDVYFVEEGSISHKKNTACILQWRWTSIVKVIIKVTSRVTIKVYIYNLCSEPLTLTLKFDEELRIIYAELLFSGNKYSFLLRNIYITNTLDWEINKSIYIRICSLYRWESY